MIFGRPDNEHGELVRISNKDVSITQRVLPLTRLGFSGSFIVRGVGGDDLGASAASLGDFNGDGINDFAVGAHKGDVAGTNAGEVYVIYGRSDDKYGEIIGDERVLTTTKISGNSTLGFAVHGGAGDNLGISIANVGDLNADGVNDLAVGANFGDSRGDTVTNSGEMHVIYGSSDNMNLTRAPLDTTDLTTVEGFTAGVANSQDNLGFSVAGLGDINEDGLNDFAVGANLDNTPILNADGTLTSNEMVDAGRLYLIYGRILNPDDPNDYYGRRVNSQRILNIGNLDISQGFVVEGEVPPKREATDTPVGITLGSAVAGIGDINGDGINDFAVSAPEGNYGTGTLYVIYGISIDDARLNRKSTIKQ